MGEGSRLRLELRTLRQAGSLKVPDERTRKRLPARLDRIKIIYGTLAGWYEHHGAVLRVGEQRQVNDPSSRMGSQTHVQMLGEFEAGPQNPGGRCF